MNCPSARSGAGRGGFTLIELLVVVAVVAVLAALLLSTLARAKTQAGITVCENNLRQQELALTMYVGDFAAYPLYESPNGYWVQSLVPYLRSSWPANNTVGSANGPVYTGTPRRSIYTCPGYDRLDGVYSTNGIWVGAYAYNGGEQGAVPVLWMAGGPRTILVSGGLGGGTNGPTRETAVAAPSQMIALGDSMIEPVGGAPNSVVGFPSAPRFSPEFSLAPQPFNTVPPPQGPAVRATLRRHGGRWDMAFCDGHVEDGPPQKYFNAYSDSVVALWSPDHRAHWK